MSLCAAVCDICSTLSGVALKALTSTNRVAFTADPNRKIGLAVDEHLPGLAPAQRLRQCVRMDGHAEPWARGSRVPVMMVIRLAHRPQAPG
jgi:hypothetical protein